MKRHVLLLAAVAGALAVSAPAALADGGPATVDTSQVQADVAKLNEDVQTRHAGVLADIQQIEADAQAGADASVVEADLAKLRDDLKQNQAAVQADHRQVLADVKALAAAAQKGDGARREVAKLLVSARTALKDDLVGFHRENADARKAAAQALAADGKQHRQAHHGKPGAATPPATTTTP